MTVIYNADAEPIVDPARIEPDATPLDFLCAVYRNPALPLSTRIRAGVAAAQYMHPRFSLIAHPTDPRLFGARLERAVREHNKAKLIEAQPQPQPTIRRRI